MARDKVSGLHLMDSNVVTVRYKNICYVISETFWPNLQLHLEVFSANVDSENVCFRAPFSKTLGVYAPQSPALVMCSLLKAV